MTDYSPLHSALRHGVEPLDGGRLCFRLWAPKHEQISLVVQLNGEPEAAPMARGEFGFFERVVDLEGRPADGLRYAFRTSDSGVEFPDPASAWQPDGVHQPSAVFDAGCFTWTDAAWKGLARDELAIYELHIGTFTDEGTLDAAASRLPELADLGVTAVELMPLAQFPGARNWGYDGVHPYAVQNSYGGPRALQRFVDAAHQLGLGVILDVVYNHFGPEGAYFASFGHYFTRHYSTPWGDAINYDYRDCDPVRSLVVGAACRWIRDFHIDGLRLDAVQTIYDLSARHILAELTDAVRATARRCDRQVVVIAETDQNDPRLTNSQDHGGHGLDGVWADDFHHSLHALLTGERNGYYEDFGTPDQLAKAYNSVFVYDGEYSRHKRRRHGAPVGATPREQFVVCIQNHDQIGNRPLGERLTTLISPEAQKLAAALLLISPCSPLIFMGEEYGERRPFPFFCSFLDTNLVEAVRAGRAREFAEFQHATSRELPDPHCETTLKGARLTWQWPEGSFSYSLRTLYRTLLRARRHWGPLRDRNCTHATIATDDSKTLVVRRGQSPAAVAYANLSDRVGPISVPGGLRPLLSTYEERFGGPRKSLDEARDLQPYEFLLLGDAECPTLPN